MYDVQVCTCTRVQVLWIYSGTCSVRRWHLSSTNVFHTAHRYSCTCASTETQLYLMDAGVQIVFNLSI